MQRRTVVFPAPEGPNRIVLEAPCGIRREAWMCGPPSYVLSMSAISSKEPHLSVETVHDRKNHKGYDEQHSGRPCRTRVIQLLHLIIDIDRKSTRLNSSHVKISYAVFCLKK